MLVDDLYDLAVRHAFDPSNRHRERRRRSAQGGGGSAGFFYRIAHLENLRFMKYNFVWTPETRAP
jgi:hypothetical protein